MKNWHRYWNSAPAGVPETEYLGQVGKTVHGRPVSEESLQRMAEDVVRGLALSAGDRLLDLCCGNGLLTTRWAEHCAQVTGVDFSEPLIRVARDRFSRPNVSYVQADVRRLPAEILRHSFSKICVYEALQNFKPEEAEQVLRALRGSESRAAPVYLASIPDRDRIWRFYDTEERRQEYRRRLEEGTEAIGTWWMKSDLADVASRAGYAIEFRDPHPMLHVAHYRFDALLRPSGANGTLDSGTPDG